MKKRNGAARFQIFAPDTEIQERCKLSKFKPRGRAKSDSEASQAQAARNRLSLHGAEQLYQRFIGRLLGVMTGGRKEGDGLKTLYNGAPPRFSPGLKPITCML